MTIVEKIRATVVPQLYESNLYFHTSKRLLADEATLMDLAKHEGLDSTVTEPLQLALLFHYLGFALDYASPQTACIEQAKILLADSSINIMTIEYLLKSIHKKAAPESSTEAVFRDTINSYWVNKKIGKRLSALKKEQKINLSLQISDRQWIEKQRSTLRKLKYFTEYATTNWKPILTKSKSKIKKSLKKIILKEDDFLKEGLGINTERLKRLKKKLSKMEGYPERGIETWFRLTSKNLYTRRSIVDTKSNIVMTVNTIIMSVGFGSVYPLLDDAPHLIYGLAPLIIANVVSIAFAILATRPKVRKGKFNRQKVLNKKASLMTFDDFANSKFEDYEWSIRQMMKDKRYLYKTITQDIYDVGIDLARRYQYLRMAYQAFLAGIITSVVFFGLCHVVL